MERASKKPIFEFAMGQSKLKILFRAFLLAVTLGFILSCNDSSSDQKALLNVILVDTPATWDSVFVTVQGVEVDVRVQGRETSLQTFFLEYKPGVKEIEVSALVGGAALLMARGELPIGSIEEVRMVLGNNHSLWEDDKQYAMPLEDSGMEIIPLAFDQDLQVGVAYDLLLDFDLERSINVLSQEPLSFSLSPKLTAIAGIGSGEIEGRISPSALQPAIYAIQGTDSLSTQTNTSSVFLFRIPEGTYTIYVDPKDDRYEPLIIPEVLVLPNEQTDLEVLEILPKE